MATSAGDDDVNHAFLPSADEAALRERWARAAETFAAGHSSDDAVTALDWLTLGRTVREVAEQFGVPETRVLEWNSERMNLMLGYPPALARTRAESEHHRPRHESTTAAFAAIVDGIYTPALKAARFTKKRHVWTRVQGPCTQSIGIQRSWATGDLLSFTTNVSVRLQGFADVLGYDDASAVDGRMGAFLSGRDQWWSIQLGRLARDSPEILDDDGECRREIAEGLRRAITWLDQIDSVPSLIAAVRNLDPTLAMSAQLNPTQMNELLKRATGTAP